MENYPEVPEIVSWNVLNGKMPVLGDDSPPAYDDILAAEVVDGEDDVHLPSYQVACQIEVSSVAV
jgi:hypothetical protein